MFVKLVFVVFLPFCLSQSVEITFKNVTFSGYKGPLHKVFEKTIPLSNSLKEYLPPGYFDIKFLKQDIPILYEDSLANLSDFSSLGFWSCGIYEIQPGAFKNMPPIRRLSIQGSNIKEIKEGVFSNLPIYMLHLKENQITTIHSHAFDNMPNLWEISLSDNKISEWNSNWFRNTPHLVYLEIDDNRITKLPNKAFKNLATNEWGGLEGIDVSLARNKIETIEPEAFSGLTEIESLDLYKNNISHLNAESFEGVNIKYITLRENRLRCLDGDLSKFNVKSFIFVDVNPMDCKCVKKLHTWKKNKHFDIYVPKMNCSAEGIDIINTDTNLYTVG